MTLDVRRGDREMLPYIFQALADYERQVALSNAMEPKHIQGWRDNRDHLARSWEAVVTVVQAYATTCPELNHANGETPPRD